MLANLFRGATGYRNNASLESATDDSHTRNLLYGHSQNIYSLAASPPPSPYGSPSFRPGSFDDHGGLDIEEKDVRILVAQDAYGSEEGPTLLFDSRNSSETTRGNTQTAKRSPLPSDWSPAVTISSQPGVPFSSRNRSSTISGAPSSWTRPTKDVGTREDAFLECMFGVTSSTKSASSTKMHIIPGRPKPVTPSRQPLKSPQSPDGGSRRTPLVRSRTSMQHPTLPHFENDGNTDAVLITRLFSVSLPDHAQIVDSSADTTVGEGRQFVDSPTNSSATPASTGSKRPKLVERKVPAFAIGLVLQLQQPSSRQSSVHTRPGSRSAPTHAFGSASSSYGSDMQTSWTFLDAIPESLASSRTFSEEGDRRVDIIVSNWDVILRSMALLEQKSTSFLREQLERTLAQVASPTPKTPKEKSMQRINQRIVAITDPAAVARLEPLLKLTNHTIRRITYAFRIPRVLTGHGLVAGHWTDETHTLYRFCGGKQQNFFLFNLLTAFLGNHTQWLERLAPDWYRKQFQATNKKQCESEVVASRTIIVSDQKGVARRLVYILASFLPGSAGLEGLQKLANDGTATPLLSTSLTSGRHSRNDHQRSSQAKHIRDLHQHLGGGEKVSLSTSASSVESTAMSKGRDILRKPLMRKDSEGFVVRPARPVIAQDGEAGNLLASGPTGNKPTTSQNPATPVAYISSSRDSYFPDGVIAETSDSIASADLSKILQRSESRHRRTSSSVSSRWGSLVSGISEFWIGRQPSSGDFASNTTTPPSISTRSKTDGSMRGTLETSSSLQRMVDQLDGEGLSESQVSQGRIIDPGSMRGTERRPSRNPASIPNLSVDDKDGVIDVDLDLPGFVRFSGNSNSITSAIKSIGKSTNTGRDGSESVCSARSVPSMSVRPTEIEQVNVGGYLRRFHEDFALHAVKGYAELVEDIKSAMRLERSPTSTFEATDEVPIDTDWITVCTTLLADTRNFSIRRLTLQRRMKRQSITRDREMSGSPSDRRSSMVVESFDEQMLDEPVMEFDTTLADAVEKALNVVDNSPAKSVLKASHSRSVSGSTAASGNFKPTTEEMASPAKSSFPLESSKADHRHMVVEALEDVVKSVNDNLNNKSRTTDENENTLDDGLTTKSALKQENVLREGVKKWMLNVEQHTKVW